MGTMTAPALAPPPESTTVTKRGIVRAIAAVTGVVDDVRDLLEPGVFRETLARRRVMLCAHHDQKRPIGKVIEAVELLPGDRRLPRRTADGTAWPREAGALVLTGALNLNTAAGREALAELIFYGADGAWSIGYVVPLGGATQRGQVRHVHRVELLHASPVLIGAHRLARTIEVKSHPGRAEVKAVGTRRRQVPLDDFDQLRHERLRQVLRTWERERDRTDGDLEPFEQVVRRDHRYELDAAGRLWKVLACAVCADPVRFAPDLALSTTATVLCEQCRRREL